MRLLSSSGLLPRCVFPVMKFQEWLVNFLNSKKKKYYGNFIKYVFVEAGNEQEDVDIQAI